MGNLDEEKKLVAEERSYRLITVEPVLFIISLCYSSSLLLVDQYVFRVLSLSFSYKESSTVSNECNNQSSEALKVQVNVQSLSSIATLVFSGITAVLCLISSLLLGGYSDRRGRKLVLIICSVAHILKYIIAAVVLGFELSYWYLVIYSIMDGISGGFIVMLAVCFAYAADITDIRKLSLKVAILESCIGIGEGLGHFLSGYLITYLTFRFAFVLLIGLAVINLIYIVFFLPEPNIREKDTTVINMKDLLNAVQVFFSKDKLKIRPRILFLNMLLIFLEGSIFSGIIAPLTYFMRGQPLCFSPIYVGYYIGSVCIIRHIGVWIGVKLFGKCAGDYGLMILGAVSGIFYMTFITFLSQTWMVFVGMYFIVECNTYFAFDPNSIFLLSKWMQNCLVLFCEVLVL